MNKTMWTGRDLWHTPEWKALAELLGISSDDPTREVTVTLRYDDVVVVKTERLVRREGPAEITTFDDVVRAYQAGEL